MGKTLRIIKYLALLVAIAFGFMKLWCIATPAWKSSADRAKEQLVTLGKSITEEQLLVSARVGDIDTLHLLSEAGININTKLGNFSPLDIAIQNRDWRVVDLLCELGVDLNENGQGREALPLWKVMEHDRFQLAQKMVDKGAEVNILSSKSQPALIESLEVEDMEAFDFLLRNGADPNISNASREPVLQLVLEKGKSEQAFALMRKGADATNIVLHGEPVIAALVSQPDRYGLSRDQIAEMISELAEAGAAVNLPESDTQQSPLLISIKENYSEAFSCLLELGADKSGCVWQAIIDQRESMLVKLLQYGADVDEKNEVGETPLEHAVRVGEDVKLIKRLLNFGADANVQTREGQPLLYVALALRREKAALILLGHERGSDITTLMNYPVKPTFRELFQKKGLLDWYCRNAKNLSPMHVATMAEQLEVVQKLISMGAKRYDKTSLNTYPVQLAARLRNVPLQQILLGVPHEDKKQQRQFIIDISDQKVYYYKGGKIVKSSRCSTGKKGFRTKTGTFIISDKKKDKVSNIYEGAKMPYFQRFSYDDFGFHEGYVGSAYASHGCIRLPMSVAKYFYYETKVGDRVTIRK